MAAITGRNIVVDPRVKGTINLATDRPVPPAAAFNQFVAALRLSGFTVVESGGLLKVVPEADAKLQGGAVSVGRAAGGSQIVTQIFRLNYEIGRQPGADPAAADQPQQHDQREPRQQLAGDHRLRRQPAAPRRASSRRWTCSNATDVEVIPLQHALAADLAPLVQRLVESAAAPRPAAPPARARPTPSFRTTVHRRAAQQLADRARRQPGAAEPGALADRQARPAARRRAPAGNIYVVYLRNAEAAKLATTLRAALASMAPRRQPAPRRAGGRAPPQRRRSRSGLSGAGSGTGQPAPPTRRSQPSAQPSTGGQIQADPATNSLIITAPEPQYRQLRAVIDRLDARRAQVYVESLIVEVNADKAAEFGIQWQNADRQQRRPATSACSAPTSRIGGAQHHRPGDSGAATGNAHAAVDRHQLRRRRATSTAPTCWASWPASSRPTATATCCPRPTC